MPKAIVLIKSATMSAGNTATLSYDLLIDTGGYQISGVEVSVSIAGSPTLINNALRSHAISYAASRADGTVLANNDIVIIGGAQ